MGNTTAAATEMSAAEIARWHEDQRILRDDARTSGSANPPAWLAKRVLLEAKTKIVADAIRAAGEIPSSVLYASLVERIDQHDYRTILNALKAEGLIDGMGPTLRWLKRSLDHNCGDFDFGGCPCVSAESRRSA